MHEGPVHLDLPPAPTGRMFPRQPTFVLAIRKIEQKKNLSLKLVILAADSIKEMQCIIRETISNNLLTLG